MRTKMATAYVPSLVEILKRAKALSEEDLKRAQELQQTTGRKLIHIVTEEGMISEQKLMFTLSSELGIPVLNLPAYKVDQDVIKLIPQRIAERHEMIPISHIGKVLTIAMSDPLDMFALDDIKKITSAKPRPVLASPQQIRAAIETFYTEEIKLDELLQDLDPDSVQVVDSDKQTDEADVSYSGNEAPVIQMVNVVLQEAIKHRVSDIHFEPFADRLRIRFRVDGALQEAFAPPRDMYNSILARIKIISSLDITEKRLPQDGRFKARFGHREIDFRVSILPTYHGEKAVLRVLDKSSVKAGLEHLGFSIESIQRFQKAIQKPYGIVLVTGPTGSGKSTTLYTVLGQLNTKDKNIMTVEDPIEYQVHGITQMQVKSDIGLTFANGLRSILRQSPDVILVGEIRDSETADISVKASLTGHLVFSTLHTNNAAGAVTRLIDMGVEPFLIASSLICATAQRLVRRICVNCKEKHTIPEEVLARLPAETKWVKDMVVYRGKGCQECKNKGYVGRMSVMEVFLVNDQIQQMIIDRASAVDLEDVERKKGMRTVFENGLEAVRAGQTTLEEVLRVTYFEE